MSTYICISESISGSMVAGHELRNSSPLRPSPHQASVALHYMQATFTLSFECGVSAQTRDAALQLPQQNRTFLLLPPVVGTSRQQTADEPYWQRTCLKVQDIADAVAGPSPSMRIV